MERDLIRITFLNTTYFTNLAGAPIEPGTVIERRLPAQFAGELEAAVSVAILDTAQTIGVGSFQGDVALNGFISGILQYFWSMIPAQQIIILMPFFSVILPASAKVVFRVLFVIAAFDMMPTESIFIDMQAALDADSHMVLKESYL